MSDIKNIKTMSAKEFRELGFLQEVNRVFLHPLGLALSVSIDAEGNETLSDIWDYRDDPEGLLYSGLDVESAKKKAEYIANLFSEKAEYRKIKYEFTVQPVSKLGNPL